MTTNIQAHQEARRNRDEALARLEKAMSIVALLEARGVTADTAVHLDQVGRDAAASLAGQRTPSEKTWAVVVSHLRQAETMADPFVGLPR